MATYYRPSLFERIKPWLIMGGIAIAATALIVTTVKITNKINDPETPTIEDRTEGFVKSAKKVTDEIEGKDGVTETYNKISIEDVIGISELQTLTYQYNSIKTVYFEDGTPKYNVAYEGTVCLGVDLSQITIDYGDEDTKNIKVILPELQVQQCIVNAGTMEYIYDKNKVDAADIIVEAQGICEQDLAAKVQNDTMMFNLAKENTESEVRALTAPIVEQLYPEYELEIVWGE